MPLYPTQPTFATTLQAFANDPALPFAQALSNDDIQQAADRHRVAFAQGQDDVFTPQLTLWTFLTQCLSPCKSCVAAVARAMVLRTALGLTPCAASTGGYCKARAKLPEAFLSDLTVQTGTAIEDQAPDAWRWKGRRVLLADGFEASLPDTPANQKDYPQSNTQKPGLGFPHLRVVVLLAFATAGLVGAAIGPCRGKETGETALFRALLDRLGPGDVVVADRYYCTWWIVAMLRQAGVDVCLRLHHKRHCDFRRGRRLGKGDHVVRWPKPARPDWMDEGTYAALPAEIEVREFRVRVEKPGFRVDQFVAATTLVDAREHGAAELGDLYHRRWHVELDIRNIKVTLGMDVLRCKSPEMIRKELWAHLLAYNLVRKVLAGAASVEQVTPRQLSFAGGVQTVNAFRWLLCTCDSGRYVMFVGVLLVAVSTHVVGDRPGRVEPRAVKRRPKPHRLLKKSRQECRAELLSGVAE
jgi:hypothetical protein